MKKIFASFLSLGLLLAACSFPSLTPTPAPVINDPLQTPWDDRSIFESGLVSSERSILNELNGASVYHIDFTIADTIYKVSGHQDVQYTNSEEIDLTEIQFRLFPNILGGSMAVSNVQVNGQTVEPKTGLKNSLLIVPLNAALEPGQSTIISMDFSVTVPQEVELNYGVLAYYENVLTLAHAYPMICVYDKEGWNAEVPPQAGDITYGDTSFYIVKITAPKDLDLIVTGSQIGRAETAETQVLYVANGPARDFYLAASPLYEEVTKSYGEVTIRSYAPGGMKDGTEMALDVAARAIGVFSKRYTPYPYTELDIVATPTLALGIEYPGMIAITSRIYDIGGDYGGAPASIYMESTVAHEAGHQWFYALVGNDQLDDPWLDESLTQFVTLQYFEDEYGAQGAAGFQDALEGRWDRAGRGDIPIGLPVSDYDGAEYGAIVYGRGPLFFVALREEMGINAFDSFLKDYAESLAWGVATPEGLQTLAEKHCACELDIIFDKWVYP